MSQCRCIRNHRVPSLNAEENVCSWEIAKVIAKGNDDSITKHINLPSLCLNPGVFLKPAYYAFDELGVTVD